MLIPLTAVAVLSLLYALIVIWRHSKLGKNRQTQGPKHLFNRRFSFLLLLIGLAYVMTSTLIERIQREQMISIFQEMELYDARQMARTLQRQIQEIREQLRKVALQYQNHRNSAYNNWPVASFYSMAYNMMDKRWVKGLSRISPEGRILYSAPDTFKAGMDVSLQLHNQKMIAERRAMIGAPFNTVQGYRAIAVMEPIYDSGHNYAGWVTALIALDDMIANFIRPTTTGGLARAGLIGQDGVILAYLDSIAGLQSIREFAQRNPGLRALSEALLHEEEGVIRYKRAAGGRDKNKEVAMAAAFARIHLGGGAYWVAGVTANEGDIIRHFPTSSWPYYALIVFSLFLIVLAFIERLRDEHLYAEQLEREISIRMDDLQRSEGRFSLFFEQCPVGLMLLDAEGNCLSANPGFGHIFGIPPERFRFYNLLRDKVWEQNGILPLINSAFAGHGANFVEAVIQIGSQGLFANLPQRSVTVRGAVFPNFDGQGAVTTVLFTCMDVTGREQAAEARLLLSTVVEQSTEAIFVTDTRGVIHYVNPAFCTLTGFQPADVLGLNSYVLLGGPAARTAYWALVRTLAQGRIWSGHLTNRRRDGTAYEVEAVISPVRDSFGRIIHFVAVNRDVTMELALEAQLRQSQKMEAIGKLAGGVAHDFNNVLTAIVGNIQLAQRQPGEVRIGKYLHDALVASERATKMVRQLLTFSRKSSDVRQPVDLNVLVRETIGLVEKSIDPRIVLIPHLDESLPRIMADPNQIHQVIMNLCVNARDAIMERLLAQSESGAAPAAARRAREIRVQTRLEIVGGEYCRLHSFASPGTFVVLAVRDDGVGMDRETMARIFEPFFTTKAQDKGTGLGLSTVYGIVKSHNGWVHVDSERGRGSAFLIYFPAAVAEDLAASGRAPAFAQASAH